MQAKGQYNIPTSWKLSGKGFSSLLVSKSKSHHSCSHHRNGESGAIKVDDLKSTAGVRQQTQTRDSTDGSSRSE
eukprot:2027100-Rhodomonas_salina.2